MSPSVTGDRSGLISKGIWCVASSCEIPSYLDVIGCDAGNWFCKRFQLRECGGEWVAEIVGLLGSLLGYLLCDLDVRGSD